MTSPNQSAAVGTTSTIQLRRGRSAQWTLVNPILFEGEVGLELDTGGMKIGDGSSPWSALKYFGQIYPVPVGPPGPPGPQGSPGTIGVLSSMASALVDLGPTLRKSGTAQLDGVFTTKQVGRPVIAHQGPSKDDDIAQVMFTADVVSTKAIRLRWVATERTRGIKRVHYLIAA